MLSLPFTGEETEAWRSWGASEVAAAEQACTHTPWAIPGHVPSHPATVPGCRAAEVYILSFTVDGVLAPYLWTFWWCVPGLSEVKVLGLHGILLI